MFDKVLIANRGEIALRVIRACRELSIRTVAIYSEVDDKSLHVRFADESYWIGAPPPAESYLNIGKIIETASKAGVDAIHPGYGFLAENADFAEACEKNGIVFVGSRSTTLRLGGNKVECRNRMKQEGIPVVSGGESIIDDEHEALALAEEIGWPVLLKSAFGGGGRGIRTVRSREELKEAFSAAHREALSAFGKFGVYVEKYIENPRHIEFQIVSDGKGKVVHLAERECSIQRRFQKLVEMSPSPVVDASIRERVGALAVKAAKAVSYLNAGTVEFIVDKGMNFYFIEMNSRLQVEHPITEMVTGLDLVKQQFQIAAGEGLNLSQEDVRLRGCAIECRINAEDPLNSFLPSAGLVSRYHPPSGPGVRVDSALYSGYEVPVHYDSLIAKLIAYGGDFEEARLRMKNALREYVIDGVATTIPLHQFIMEDTDFRRGDLSTDFLQRRLPNPEKLKAKQRVNSEIEETAAAIAALYLVNKGRKPVRTAAEVRSRNVNGWRSSHAYSNRWPEGWRHAEDF
ncbi:MAG: acetyl-CoA carboxylase biotin carboxylase subunit [Thaumarchaeota archaeon]|nr:acetyl-CoA carboxylase biotin carboxylase subunit [Nitrososphaerota archaeon]